MIYLDKRDRSRIAVICAVVFVAIIAFNQDIRQTVGHAILYGVGALFVVQGVCVAYIMLRFPAEWIADLYSRVRSGSLPWAELAALSVLLLLAYGMARMTLYG
jgi:hypothetical protein